METALHFYTLAKDYLFLVRVYCYCNNLEKAAEIGSQMGNISACYHLARQYENIDNIAETIHFFTSAQAAYSNAVPMYERLDAHKFEIVHVLGIKFWQKTVEKQKVNDIKHCKVIINYLQGFISDLNKNFIINGYSRWDCFVFSKN